MKNSSLKKAFSLIELSLVILVIGVLIAGVVQASNLVFKFKIKTVQNLTRNSPVGSIQDLYLWLEPVMDESFLSSESIDGNKISIWQDINPQAKGTDLYSAVIETGESPNIFYDKSSPIGDLPSLLFSSPPSYYKNYLGLSKKNSSGSFVATLLKTPNNAFTFCAIMRGNSFGGFPAGFSNGSGYSYWGYGTNGANRSVIANGQIFGMPAGSFKLNKNEILCASCNGLGLGDVNIFVNGAKVASGSLSSSTLSNASQKLYIGSGGNGANPWLGYLSEFIVYGRALKNNERKEIEAYLSRKYKITLSS
jgi:prepilin-type N-terminal cleavage/methylation domain-containing protein